MFLRSRYFAKDYTLGAGVTIVGRQKSCQVVLHSELVSKNHLEIEVDGYHVRVRDLNSHNGTTLNDVAIEPMRWYTIRSGARIRICNIDIELLDEIGSSSSSCAIVEKEDSRFEDSKSLNLSGLSNADRVEDQRLAALVQLTQSMIDVLHIDAVLEKSVDILLKIFTRAERVAIAMSDETGVHPKWWKSRGETAPSSIEISRTLVRHVIERCEAIISIDAQVDFGNAPSIHEMNVRSVLCAPLIATEGAAYGVIYLDTALGGQFASSDLEILAAVAAQLSLAINFSRMHEVALQDALVRRDVESAKAIQLQYLPAEAPQVPGFDIAGFYRPARHIGGDYYDYIVLEDGRVAVVLGDVVGKGVPAALTMVRLATETRTSLESCGSIIDVLARLNQRLNGMFITLIIVVIDPRTGRLTISNAGHELPLLRRCDSRVESIAHQCTSCPIGVLEGETYIESILDLAPDESLTIFSDGFPDAEASDATRWGREKLAAAVAACQGSSQQSIQHVTLVADRFIGDHAQFDDMCIVHIRRC